MRLDSDVILLDNSLICRLHAFLYSRNDGCPLARQEDCEEACQEVQEATEWPVHFCKGMHYLTLYYEVDQIIGICLVVYVLFELHCLIEWNKLLAFWCLLYVMSYLFCYSCVCIYFICKMVIETWVEIKLLQAVVLSIGSIDYWNLFN